MTRASNDPHGTLPAAMVAMLDNPIWSALDGPQRPLTEGDAVARRMHPVFAPFGAVSSRSHESLRALARMLGPEDEVAMFSVGDVDEPAELTVTMRADMVQMVAHGGRLAPLLRNQGIVALTESDAPEMLALAELTKPGPFRSRTHELGRFVGIRENGALIAMAGERLRLDGATEVSGVCTHPHHRGRQLAYQLVLAVAHAMVARGELPFLHAFTENVSAIALYEKLGFTLRANLRLTIMQLATAIRVPISPH